MAANKEKRLQLVAWASAPGTDGLPERAHVRPAKRPGADPSRARKAATAQPATTSSQDDAAPGNAHAGAPEQLRRAEREIAALRKELEILRGLVHVDHLTGTLNRCGLDPTFAREAARADRNNSPLGVALLDIDDFKLINDRHGHQVGDAALVHLAEIIRKTIRPSDTVVRFGGEEFLFLLPDSGAEQATRALTRLQHELDRNPVVYGKKELRLSFSAGVAVRGRRESRDAIIGHADRALYQAKQAGKRCVVTASYSAAGTDLRALPRPQAVRAS